MNEIVAREEHPSALTFSRVTSPDSHTLCEKIWKIKRGGKRMVTGATQEHIQRYPQWRFLYFREKCVVTSMNAMSGICGS